MAKDSKNFEHQIERIHRLIEESGAEVSWNEKIPDPDNPKQDRQIDVSIKRDGKLTHIECRFREAKQDVKWIEELIGRKQSLKADGMIAVSSSGFTEGAIKKAEAHGIVARDLIKLTDQEILDWGMCTKVKISYFYFNPLNFLFYFDSKEVFGRVHIADLVEEIRKRNLFLRNMLEKICHEVEEQKLKYPLGIQPKVEFSPPLNVNGFSCSLVVVKTMIHIEEVEIETPVVMAYGNPEDSGTDRSVIVEKKDLGKSEVIQSGDTVSMVIDLSALKCLPNRLFRYHDFDFLRKIKAKEVTFIGNKDFLNLKLSNVGFGIGHKGLSGENDKLQETLDK